MDTRSIIRDAAFDLFSRKRFKDITVQDILDLAKCSRYTFYRYYQDKYELMRLYYTSFVSELLLQKYSGDNFPDIQAQIFQFILENRGYFTSIKDLQGPESFWSFLASYTTAFFTTVKQLNTGMDVFPEEERYEMAFVVSGAISVFQKYVEDREYHLTPEQVSGLLCTHYPPDYYILPREKREDFSAMFDRSLRRNK